MSEIVTFPEDSYDYSSDEVGGALAGLIVRDSLGVPRAGILPSSNQLLSGRNDWQVNVAPFIGVAVEDKVVRLGGNDGEMQTSVDEPPSSGGRVDRICWDPQMGTPVIHVVPGTPGSSPVAPTTPAGMVSLGTVRLDAGDTSTSQGLFVADFPFTSTAGGVLMVRSSGELDDWEPADGAEAFNLADGVGYVRAAGTWKPSGAVVGPISYVPVVSGYSTGFNPVMRAQYTKAGSTVEVELQAETEREMSRIVGPLLVTVPVPIATNPISVDGSGYFMVGPVGAKRLYNLKVRQASANQVVVELVRTDGRAAELVPLQQGAIPATDWVSWRARFRYTAS